MDESAPMPEPSNHSERFDSPAMEGGLAGFRGLDRRVIQLWRVHHLIGSTALLAMAGAPCVFLSFKTPWLRGWLLGAWLGLAILRLILWVWHPPRSYRAWGYRLDDKVLEIKNGIFFRAIQLLPLNRLQHVDLQRGPLERYFGLTTMILHTAGTHESHLLIPGLEADEAVRLRDQLAAIGGDDGV